MQSPATLKPRVDPSLETPDVSPASEPVAAAPAETRPDRSQLRRRLFILGPLVMLGVAALLYFNSGRYVETDNAYLKANKVTISPEVAGRIISVAARENQQVAEGDELFRLDDQPYRIALDRSDAQLRTVQAEIEGIKASYRQKQEQLRMAENNLAFSTRELARQTQLAKQRLTSQVKLDEAQHSVDTARDQMAVIAQDLAQTLTQLTGNANLPVEKHPRYLEAAASRDTARLNLQRVVVIAPFAGVTSKVPQVGQYVAAGGAVMSVVATTDTWIEANFMETDLTHVRVGQPVAVVLDTYSKQKWHGTVQSISQATGAEFSVLPPQNATGNWVKVVQRIPVRISLETTADAPPLRAGMTATAKIDTGRHHTLSSLFSMGGTPAGASDAEASGDTTLAPKQTSVTQ
jgi:membrane fusion protein, multidrug efflux system